MFFLYIYKQYYWYILVFFR
uniref:Uncharacterized protein n=1 Tax=Anguilla anguilla TaxID=7936 RepID=A0A0E9Q1P8_ANGAN